MSSAKNCFTASTGLAFLTVHAHQDSEHTHATITSTTGAISLNDVQATDLTACSDTGSVIITATVYTGSYILRGGYAPNVKLDVPTMGVGNRVLGTGDGKYHMDVTSNSHIALLPRMFFD